MSKRKSSEENIVCGGGWESECTEFASYGVESKGVQCIPTRCWQHKTPNMTFVKRDQSICEQCEQCSRSSGFVATYGIRGTTKRIACMNHKTEDMINLPYPRYIYAKATPEIYALKPPHMDKNTKNRCTVNNTKDRI